MKIAGSGDNDGSSIYSYATDVPTSTTTTQTLESQSTVTASTTNIHPDVYVAPTADGSGVNKTSNKATNFSPSKSPPSYPHTDTVPVYATRTATSTSILSSARDNSTPSLKPHPEPMMMVTNIATPVVTSEPAMAMATTPRRTSLSSGGSGSGNVSVGGGCWTDDEAYENLPKTPLAPPQTSLSTSSSSRSLLRQSTMSPVPGSAGSSVGSGGFYLPDIPPAPPTTPAAGSMLLTTIAMGSCATPLPYTGGFVQNTYQLEQQLEQRQLQQSLTQNQQQQDQLLQNAGAATPAPPKPQTQSSTPKTRTATTSLSDDFSEWAVGDRYKLSRMLGRGSYGEVAQAVDLYQGRADAFVAIKRIVGPFEQEVDAVRLFREIHILRLLKALGTNDCIVPLLDVVQPPTDDLNDFHDLYLVFDYVDTDLYKLIMSPQYLTTEHIQTFLYQMLIGLKYIHSCNVIHRDLKPANILLNEDCSLKICDFGLARIVDEVSVAISTSSTSAVNTPVVTKRAGGRSCSIAEQVLSHDDNDDKHVPTMPAKTPLTRQLTKHVVTRWYRAPELILIQPYTTAVDIWSMGCIFAELLSMQEGSVPGYQDRTPLFPGGACYPLSGDTDNEERIDQLNVIFGVIGTPSEEDIAEVGKANEYIKTLKSMRPKSLKDIYPAADPNALDLLHNMLKFNPKQRYTAGEALEHEFFSGIRREEMETSATKPMENPEFLNDQNIGIEILKQKTYEEVLWFRDKSVRPNPPQEQPSTE